VAPCSRRAAAASRARVPAPPVTGVVVVSKMVKVCGVWCVNGDEEGEVTLKAFTY